MRRRHTNPNKPNSASPAAAGDKLSYAELKPWVIASSAGFKKGAAPPALPAGQPGADVACLQADFDDSA